MRNKLLAALTLCGVTAFSTSSWAGDWVKPTYKTVVPTLNQDTEGESYYIQHVATGKFLTAANFAGTQLSVGDAGQKCVLTYGVDVVYGIAESDGIKNSNYKTGYEAVKGWMFSMPGAPSNRWSHYIYPKDNGEAYVDMGEEGHILWDIVKNENETYTIKIVAQDWKYGGPSQWNENGNVNTMNGVWGRIPVKEGTDNNTVVNVFCDKGGNAEHADAETEWAFVAVDEYESVHGRIVLIDALEAAEAAGFTDYAQWEALLNQENVTLEECEKAVEELNKAVADYKLSLATPEKPIEVTELIKNASFGTNPIGNGTGWICTTNPETKYQSRDDGEVGTTGRHIHGFPETWQDAGGGGRNGWDMHQTITDLPIGKYRVYADMMGINQGDETAKPYGYWLYADGGGAPVQTEGGAAFSEEEQKYMAGKGTENSVEVSCLRGSLTIGVKSDGTNCNWMTVDNFRMFYLGPDNSIFQSELEGVIAAAEAVLPANWPVDENNYGAGKAEIAKFNASLEAAKNVLGALTSYTSDEILDATDDLKLRTDSLVAEMKAYTELNDYLYADEGAGINEYYGNSYYGELLNDENSENFKDFNDLSEAMYASLANGSYSAKDIAELRDSLKATFVSGVKLAIKNGDTNVVTGLLANPGFDDSKNTGWSGTMDKNAGEGVPVAQFWGGRVNTFDQYQELTGLPEGSYTVTVQGLYRAFNSSSNVVNYTGAEAEKVSYSYLYANDAETRIMNMMEGAIADQPENAEGSWVQLVNATDEYANMWVPNDLRACNFHYAADRGNYLNSVICYVGADGVLRLGVRKTYSTTDYWTCVDNFTVTYLGKTAVGKFEAVKAAAQRGQNALDNVVGHYYTDDAQSALNTAVATANGLLDEGAEPTVEQCDEAIAAVDAAIEQFNKSMALADEVYNWASTFESDYNNSKYSEEYYEELYNEVSDVLDVFQRSSYATYDELNAEYGKLKSLFAKAQQDDMFGEAMKNATKDEPVDVTALITNPNMEVMDLATGDVKSSYEGWTLEYTPSEGTTNVKPDNFSMEVFNAENFRFYQKLYNLPAGTYRMTFQGFYRAGTSVGAGVARRDGKEKLNAFAYAALNDETKGYPGKEIASIFTEMTSSMVTNDMVALSDTIFGAVKYVPNTMGAFHTICNQKEGAYLNELFFGVPEGGADVTIGLGKDVRIAEDWCIFDTFKLYYLGAGAENDPVAVEGVEAETAPVSTTWYTVDGVQVNKPAHSGLYIRVQRMADGTTNTTKVMVK